MNDVAFGGDGDFSDRKLADSVNSHLANALGNLAYRTLSFASAPAHAQRWMFWTGRTARGVV